MGAIAWRAIAVACACQVLSCAITHEVYERGGEVFGVIDGAFRGRWYNYYERGLSYARGGYCQEAIADFDEAMALRHEDQRRARTYGLHFIDYFPKRERAICLLRLGKLSLAIEGLTASLTDVDSGRAEYFLNQARRRQIFTARGADAAPPEILMVVVSGTTRETVLKLSGTIRDPGYIASVRVNGVPLLIPVAVPSYPLSTEVSLSPGQNEVVVEATDLFGNLGRQRLSFILDEQPPAVTLDGLREEAGQLLLLGAASDDSGVVVARAAGEVQSLVGDRTHKSFVVPVTADAKLRLAVEDVAGNTTEVQVDVAALRRGNSGAGAPSLSVSEIPEVVFTDRIFVDGTASDGGRVERLSVNGESLAGMGRPTVYFRRIVHLKEGKNVLRLVATDDEKRSTEKVFEIERRLAAQESIENRLSVTMAPFVRASEESGSADAVENNLEAAIVEQKRFRLLDRERVRALMTELQLTARDLTQDGPDLLEVGQAMNADTTMLGSIKENGSSIEVYGRLVDSQTGQILLEKDVFHEKRTLRNIRDLLFGLGLKLKAAMPVLVGELVNADGEAIRVSMQNAESLPNGAHLVLMKNGEVESVVGQARINGVEPNAVRAEIISGLGDANVVFTK